MELPWPSCLCFGCHNLFTFPLNPKTSQVITTLLRWYTEDPYKVENEDKLAEVFRIYIVLCCLWRKEVIAFFPLYPFSLEQFPIEIYLSAALLRLISWVILNMGDSAEIKLVKAELKISGCGEITFCEMPLDCAPILAHSESLPVLKHNSLHDLAWPPWFITDQENGRSITYSLLTP